MTLTTVYSLFVKMTSEEQDLHMAAYRLKRDTDLADIPVMAASKANGFSEEEKALMKKLGFSVRDLKTLKECFS